MKPSATMRAVRVLAPGGVNQLVLGAFPCPRPTDDELLVRVEATALNRADLLQREGKYPPPPGASEILGLELAGTVAAVGVACADWQVGDRVFGLLSGGGYAEYAVLHHKMAMPIPDNLSFEEAAAVPEVFLTAYQALCWLGELREGNSVLIHAGASGVGTAAIQLVRVFGGRAFITASPAKHDVCLQLGAEEAIDYKTEDFAERIVEITEGRGVDLILDFIGAPYLEMNARCLATDGVLVFLAMMGGGMMETFDLRAFFRKRAHLKFTTLRSRSLDYKIKLTKDFAGSCLPWFESGELQPVIDSIFDWQDVSVAHQHMADNKNTGKIVLRVR